VSEKPCEGEKKMYRYNLDRAPPAHKVVSEEELPRRPYDDFDTLAEIGNECDADAYTVWRSYAEHDMMIYISSFSSKASSHSPWNFRSVLEQFIIKEARARKEVAEMLDCHESTLKQRLNDFDISYGTKQLSVGQFWRQQREDALKRDDNRCFLCRSETELDVHHIVPRKHFDDKETADALENLVVLCTSCHRKVEYRSPRVLFKQAHNNGH